MRMIIAEDDKTSRQVLENVLTKLGHSVVAVSDGEQAWNALREPNAPRLALLDWMMPCLDGIDVVKRVRELPNAQQLYLIMLTARDSKQAIVEALQAGANDYIIKPYHNAELRARIDVGCRYVEMQSALESKVTELQRTLADIKTLQGMLPICSHCKKVRDDQNYWHRVETYLSEHSGMVFSHSICPECAHRYYPDLDSDEE